MKAMRKAGAAGLAMAAMAAAGGAGAFGGIKCPSPEIYLVVCCPKPCPVVDFAKVAKNAVKNGLEELKLVQMGEQNREIRNTEEAFGRAGRRSVTPEECPAPGAAMPELGRADAGFTTAEGVREPVHPGRTLESEGLEKGREDVQVSLERVRQQAAADAWEAERVLGQLMDTCAEAFAKASDAVPRATDVREMVRRTVEMRTAIARCDQVETMAKAHARRIRATRWLHTGLGI